MNNRRPYDTPSLPKDLAAFIRRCRRWDAHERMLAEHDAAKGQIERGGKKTTRVDAYRTERRGFRVPTGRA